MSVAAWTIETSPIPVVITDAADVVEGPGPDDSEPDDEPDPEPDDDSEPDDESEPAPGTAAMPSSLRMVPVATARASAIPPVGFESSTANVSSGSIVVSPATVTPMAFSTPVSPDAAGVKVREPVLSLKSAPATALTAPVALVAVTAYCTVTGTDNGCESVTGNDIVRVPESPSRIDASPIETVAKGATTGGTDVGSVDGGPSVWEPPPVSVFAPDDCASPEPLCASEASGSEVTAAAAEPVPPVAEPESPPRPAAALPMAAACDPVEPEPDPVADAVPPAGCDADARATVCDDLCRATCCAGAATNDVATAVVATMTPAATLGAAAAATPVAPLDGGADRRREPHRAAEVRNLRERRQRTGRETQLAERHTEERAHHLRRELHTGRARQLGPRDARRHRLLVGPDRGHDLVGVGHRDDRGRLRDLVAAELPRVARCRSTIRGDRRPRRPTCRGTGGAAPRAIRPQPGGRAGSPTRRSSARPSC